jgi:ATP-binding protein involved in chromosome partitioning
LGVIENMSYFESRKTGEREYIFGSGGADKISEKWGFPVLGKIPLTTTIRETSDGGRPIVLEDPSSPSAEAFIYAAKNLAAQISVRNLKAEAEDLVKISF